MKTDPQSIAGNQIEAAYKALGLDPDLYRATINLDIDLLSGSVNLHRYVFDENGNPQIETRKVLENGYAIAAKESIPIDWSAKAVSNV